MWKAIHKRIYLWQKYSKTLTVALNVPSLATIKRLYSGLLYLVMSTTDKIPSCNLKASEIWKYCTDVFVCSSLKRDSVDKYFKRVLVILKQYQKENECISNCFKLVKKILCVLCLSTMYMHHFTTNCSRRIKQKSKTHTQKSQQATKNKITT